MKEAAEFIERLIWFVYRVLFTLFPSIILLLILALFTKEYFPQTIEKLETAIQSLGVEKWIILIAIIFCINLILEAATNLITYRILNLKEPCNNVWKEDTALQEILKKYNPDILGLLKKNKGSIDLNESLFNFGLLGGNQKSIWFNNYIWFLISREYLFSNISLVFIFSLLFLFPYSICKESQSFEFLIYQILQTAFVVGIFIYSRGLLRNNYPRGNNLERDNIIGLLSTLTPCLIALVFVNTKAGLFVFVNSLAFFICPMLFLRVFREYLHVGYLIMMFLAREGYDKEMNQQTNP